MITGREEKWYINGQNFLIIFYTLLMSFYIYYFIFSFLVDILVVDLYSNTFYMKIP